MRKKTDTMGTVRRTGMQKIELNHEELDFRSREAFRTLRTNIEFSGDDVKVICLTS